MRILLAVDHSSASDTAMEFVRELPLRESVDLHVVTVISPVPFVDATVTGIPPDVSDILEEERKHFESRLADSMSRFNNDQFRSVSGEVRIGAPAAELIDFARERQIDLIVMGAIGHSAIERVMLGSVSDHVATHADAAVLVVRPKPATTVKPRRILLALDCDDHDNELANWVQRLQPDRSAEIHLVHVMQRITFYSQDVLQQASELWKQMRSTAEAHAEAMANTIQKHGYQAVADVISAPHIGDALIQYAEQQGCELIVTGDHHRSKLNRLFMGSVSRHVLRHAPCSVLVIRS